MKSMTGFGRSTNRLSHASRAAGGQAPMQPTGKPKKTAEKTSARNQGQNQAQNQPRSQGEPASTVELDVSIKSVNGRYLDIRFHLPREYAGFEGEFKNLIAQRFSRGTFDVYVNRVAQAGATGFSVNTSLAQNWVDGYRLLGKTLKLKAAPTLELLSRVPEIFHLQDRVEVTDAERAQVRQLVDEAAKACDDERAREGQALQKELSSLCGKLEVLASEIEKIKGEANAELEKRLRDRLHDHLQKLGFEGKVDDQRIAQEIVMSIDRADISEELTRLRAHLKAYRGLLQNGGSEGKKLDFYAQELLREVNTIGSKSHIAKLTSHVVDAKTLIEKIREQVQNVE